MVAKITLPRSVRGPLCYNERKVEKGQARCLYAHQYLKPAASLSFAEKGVRLQRLKDLNQRAVVRGLHVSLNFAPGEVLDEKTLIAIAGRYMEGIGFGGQPYLVYQHFDAAHPHLHLVSTSIQRDGRRIKTHNIGRHASEKTRKEIEITFGLQRAGGQKERKQEEVTDAAVQRVVYGKSRTKEGIEKVVMDVLTRYRFASLSELNAVLKGYNVQAQAGQGRGVLYRVLDDKGHSIGVPLNAGSLKGKPTMDYLESLFIKNDALKKPHKQRLKGRLDWVLSRPLKSLTHLEQELANEKVSLVTWKNETGFLYGLTYVDHNSRCVFNGSELGKPYSAKAMTGRFENAQKIIAETKTIAPNKGDEKREERVTPALGEQHQTQASFIQNVLQVGDGDQSFVPYELRGKKKKRRKP